MTSCCTEEGCGGAVDQNKSGHGPYLMLGHSFDMLYALVIQHQSIKIMTEVVKSGKTEMGAGFQGFIIVIYDRFCISRLWVHFQLHTNSLLVMVYYC